MRRKSISIYTRGWQLLLFTQFTMPEAPPLRRSLRLEESRWMLPVCVNSLCVSVVAQLWGCRDTIKANLCNFSALVVLKNTRDIFYESFPASVVSQQREEKRRFPGWECSKEKIRRNTKLSTRSIRFVFNVAEFSKGLWSFHNSKHADESSELYPSFVPVPQTCWCLSKGVSRFKRSPPCC